ncbi:MAG TPA: MBL fold metallo-hydrolase [Patescibacteria group bacterium]|nr:MBL fold metallo-hydrolase [Patescibacteria group bacterium]
MEIEYYGANCFRVTTKKASLTFDDNLVELGLKSVTKPGDIALFSGPHGQPAVETKLVIDQPGEYEVSGVSIQGVGARAHMDEANQMSGVMFKLLAEDIRFAAVGHIYPELSDEQLEALGVIDVLMIPVGGNGYTLDGEGALKVIKKIEPKIVIPTHYADSKLKYTVPQQGLEEVIKALAMEPRERLPKLKLKVTDLSAEGTQLVILERQ